MKDCNEQKKAGQRTQLVGLQGFNPSQMEMLQTPPPSMLLSGNVVENWKKFKQRFEIYRIASGTGDRDSKLQVSLLPHGMGEESIEI